MQKQKREAKELSLSKVNDKRARLMVVLDIDVASHPCSLEEFIEILKENRIEVTTKQLVDWLAREEYISVEGTIVSKLFDKGIKSKLMGIGREIHIYDDGSGKEIIKPLITPKGQSHFIQQLLLQGKTHLV